MSTVGQPRAIVPPWAVVSPILAAGWPPIRTAVDPKAITSGGPTQVAMSPCLAAGVPPIRTVGHPGGSIGPPTWGMGTTAGVCMGQMCMSPTLAAGCPISNLLSYPEAGGSSFSRRIFSMTPVGISTVSLVSAVHSILFRDEDPLAPSWLYSSFLPP